MSFLPFLYIYIYENAAVACRHTACDYNNNNDRSHRNLEKRKENLYIKFFYPVQFFFKSFDFCDNNSLTFSDPDILATPGLLLFLWGGIVK